MNKINETIKSIIIFLSHSKIKFHTKIMFLAFYVYGLTRSFFVKQNIVKCRFLTGTSFQYYGIHKNLLLNHINTHLLYYFTYYKNAKTVIDVGASFGTFSLMVNFFNPSTDIYSFEPSKETFFLLRNNCYKINKIKIFNQAVGAKKTKVYFFHDQSFPEGSRVHPNKKKYTYKVAQTSLDLFIKTNNIKAVSLLKIDVEGYELEVLKGASKTLAKVSWLIIEVDTEKLKNLIDILDCLNKHQFILFDIGVINYHRDIKGKVCSFDLIFQRIQK